MKKKKLLLKKITVSNLSEEVAKSIYGGDMPTYGTNCSYSCTPNNTCQATQRDCVTYDCPSGPNQNTCTYNGCQNTVTKTTNSPCFSQWANCTYTQCTDIKNTCQATYTDQTC
ncbi:MAG: hypothetical protein JST68_30165 [Bacteroidetes bacterium]|nr:hypothetical protein [Bacteroidota bacterium]